VAEKWTTAVTSVTGVFSIVALIKGPTGISDLHGGQRVVAVLAIGAAVVFALAAITLAALAAEGTPKLRRFSGAQLRSQVRSQAKLAKLQLKISRTAAVSAVLCLVVAVGRIWL
jgi:hypothetical protein